VFSLFLFLTGWKFGLIPYKIWLLDLDLGLSEIGLVAGFIS